MPANLIEINGDKQFTLGDSKMPPLMKWLETYSYESFENITEGEKPDTIFSQMVELMALAHYGADFGFMKCVIEFDSNGVGVTRFEREVTGQSKE